MIFLFLIPATRPDDGRLFDLSLLIISDER